ncbi:MAG: T9SS type A sorting domain-containing protein, partial [Bacteroidales bacterium]|nr:T9SS type A sorting domain-containing protein [Bacteroidales bacterium]
SVTIGNSVRLISYKAFYGCNNLQKVISFAVSRPFLVNEVFSDTVAILKVPCGSANSYSSQWSQYFVNIEEICDSITITATSANDSIGIVSGGGEYEFGASATITATPNEGYSFVSWNDGNTDNPRAITITEDATYIANFAANTYSITVISDNDSMGTVLGGGEYEFETEVTIIAIPNEGYHFVSWNDGNTNNPRIITLTGDTTFIANFTLDNYTVTVTSANDSMGIVSGSGEYVFGTEVTITATPNEGYRFVSWNDGNTDNPRTITVTEDATYIATFEEGVGIESRDMLSELTFYPNPTSGIITFNRNDIMKVEVLDAMGRTVEVYENAYTIDISKLAKGYYAMRITTAEGVAVRKVIRK